MNPTLTIAGPRPVLRMERRLAHPVEKVWRALTDPEQSKHWFPGAFSGDLVVGGKLAFAPSGPGEDPSEGVVTEVEPPRLLAFEWVDQLLRWELFADGAGCLLVLEHFVDFHPDAASFASGWEMCFDSLAHTLDGAPQPWGTDGWAPRHEELVELFGLRDGTVISGDDGVLVWFARPLTAPVAEVKPVLDAVGAPAAGADPAAFRIEDGAGPNARVVVEQRLPAGTDAAPVRAAWKAYLQAIADRLPGGSNPVT